MKGLEKTLVGAVDLITAILYLYIGFMAFFSEDSPLQSGGGADWFALLLIFAFVAIIAKILKSIFGTIGRAFDSTFANQD